MGSVWLISLALLNFGKLANSLYAHELALHVNHNIDEFKAPFSANSLRSCSFIDAQASNESYLPILGTIAVAAQGLLDSFMELSTSEMLALPPHIYAGRLIYATILLIKLYKAVLASTIQLNEGISVGQLRVEEYIERLLLISKWLGTEDDTNSLSRAFLIMPQLKQWFYSHISKLEFEKNEDISWKDPASGHCADPMPATTNSAGSQDNLSLGPNGQPSTLPASPNTLNAPSHRYESLPVQNESFARPAGTFSRDLISDSWFWEFFNVNMLD